MVSGLSVDLSSIGPSGLVELCVILLVAVAGKFGGAFAGARLAGVGARRSGALATLMNTRGLTGIVILSTGLQLHILDQSLYSLMIVMAVVTTMMAGPLLHLIYPDRYVQRDIAEADRAALGTSAEHRILVLIEAPETAAPIVEVGAALAISREHSELVLSHLVAHQHDSQMEVGTGLGGELLDMTRTTETLQVLADRASARGAPAVVRSRFSQDVSAELPGYVAAAQPDTIVLGPGGTLGALTADGTVQLVTVLRSLPEAPAAVAVRWARGEGGAAAVQVAAQLAVANRLKLVISPGGGRRAGLAARLTREGIAASDGPPPAGAIVVTAAAHSSGDPHLAVLPGTREGSDDLDQWVQQLTRADPPNSADRDEPPGQGIADHRSPRCSGRNLSRAGPVPLAGRSRSPGGDSSGRTLPAATRASRACVTSACGTHSFSRRAGAHHSGPDPGCSGSSSLGKAVRGEAKLRG